MARQKKPVHRVEMTDGKRNIIRQLLEEYDIETAEDIQCCGLSSSQVLSLSELQPATDGPSRPYV